MTQNPEGARFYATSSTTVLNDLLADTATRLGGRLLARTAATDTRRRRLLHRMYEAEDHREATDPDDRDALTARVREWKAQTAMLPRPAGEDSTDASPREVCDRDVAPFLFRGRHPSDRPVLVLLGAQPAAGKTRAQTALTRTHPDLAPLSGDTLRRFDPRYDTLMDHDPLAMPNATAPTTLRTARAFAAAGYRVHLVALAVNERVSRLDSVNRYLAPGPANRWTPATAHDLGYRMTPHTVREAQNSPHVHRVTVTDRSGRELPTGDGRSAADTLLAHREAPWTRTRRGPGPPAATTAPPPWPGAANSVRPRCRPWSGCIPTPTPSPPRPASTPRRPGGTGPVNAPTAASWIRPRVGRFPPRPWNGALPLFGPRVPEGFEHLRGVLQPYSRREVRDAVHRLPVRSPDPSPAGGDGQRTETALAGSPLTPSDRPATVNRHTPDPTVWTA
ncbi:zeta toxin family protein [Nocardiopsis sp. CNT312]|uniref:zeta toxin family protein n=1 Tax=Nocardiopsis sp. CNT312 TaxID=1137268 RepID=UPI00048E88A4|nr:zeta toxin family protein [Nocardiopsis sp. CNT312]